MCISENTGTSLYVISEHLMFGYGLENLLHQSQTNVTVVGHATSMAQATEHVRVLQPDIVLLYSHEPLLAGASLATRLLALSPVVRIISMSVDDNTMYCYQVAEHYINGVEDLLKALCH